MKFIKYIFFNSVYVTLVIIALSAADKLGLVHLSLEESSCYSVESNKIAEHDTVDEEHLEEMIMANQKSIEGLANQLKLNDSINNLNNELQDNKVTK